MSHVDDGTLNALLDGEISGAEARVVETHLAACAECRGRFEEARAFLAEAGELLSMLGPPATQAGTPPRRVSQTAKEAAVDPDAPRRVSATSKEQAVDPDAGRRVAATSKEHAVNIDAGTQKSPAIRPLFAQGGDRAGPTPPTAQSPALPDVVPLKPRRPWDVERLAWAASIVLALGVGYLVNEVRTGRREVAEMAARMDREPAAVALAADSASTVAPVSRTVATPARRPSGSRLGRLPRDTTKPPTPDAMADAALRGAASGLERAAEQRRDLAGAGAAGAAGGAAPAERAAGDSVRARELAAAPAAPRPAAPAPAQRPTRLAQEPPREGARRQGAGAQPQRPADATPPVSAAAPPAYAARRADRATDSANRLEEVAVTGALDQAGRVPAPMPRAFRRISFDTAITRLSGSIRLIDGMDPLSVEEGPGHLVPGADPGRAVIRVMYRDAAGRRLTLDQQPGDARPGPTGNVSVNGLMRGDTLMTGGGDGSLRIRWVDRKGFWLSLTAANVPGEEMRALVERIR